MFLNYLRCRLFHYFHSFPRFQNYLRYRPFLMFLNYLRYRLFHYFLLVRVIPSHHLYQMFHLNPKSQSFH
jgi:hypothetical protein